MWLFTFTTLFWFIFESGLALQIQCYQCEELTKNNCSTPDFIVNCTVNVQDMCIKEVLVRRDGVFYRKACAVSGSCLVAESGYQQHCHGRLNSVCISCCSEHLCNGPRPKRKHRARSSAPPLSQRLRPLRSLPLLLLLLLLTPPILC